VDCFKGAKRPFLSKAAGWSIDSLHNARFYCVP
jgi:hypothetical protein